MRAIQILLLYLSLTVAACAGDRKYVIDSPEEKIIAKKALLAQLAPLVVLREIGMPAEDATLFSDTYMNGAMVEGHEEQVDYNYRHAQRVLTALPAQYSNEFMRLTYQWVGPSALLREEVADAVDLTQEQQRKVQEVYYEFSERIVPANRPDFSYQMTPEERRAYNTRSQQIKNDGDRELLDVLTPDQITKWKELLGAPSPALKEFRDYCDKNR